MCILRQAFEVPCIIRKIILICCDSGALAALQSKPRMGRTYSTTHPGLFHVIATTAPL